MTERGTIPSPGYEGGCGMEWLVANGLGGYASSTAVGANTRAYHGLLVSAVDTPADRRLLLSSLDEEAKVGADGRESFQLANHQYPGAVYPRGYAHLQEFAQDPLPRFSYRLGEAEVEKTVFMLPGENSTLVRYCLGGQGEIAVRPLVHCRNFHSASPLPGFSPEQVEGGVRLHSELSFYILSDRASYMPEELRFYNLEYQEEQRRGLAWTEDCYSPGCFRLSWKGEESFAILASTTRSSMPDAAACWECERERAWSLQAPVTGLARAADSFLVRRGRGHSIIAGYHWFNDWGRDAMISLPGLLLSTGRFREARETLCTFAGAMQGGIVPNDLGARSYNTVDASLWFVQAFHQYYQLTGDRELLQELWPSLNSIVQAYTRGTSVARMDQDGLIVSQAGMTWMDARVDGEPVTPRAGKCCEINALWYALLRALSLYAPELGVEWDDELMHRVKKSYRRFWNDDAGCLYDVIDPQDPSVRPNQ
ncbi:MAG: glycogen debranching protein, partial [Methanosarcinales archaeon]|nr:glycogen debranching protein [Methanosarcinales archaeon]